MLEAGLVWLLVRGAFLLRTLSSSFLQTASVVEVPGEQVMKLSDCVANGQSWQQQATGIALAVGVLLLGTAPLENQFSSQPGHVQSSGISADPGAKSAAREAKKRERAEAREAKKKERASRSSKSDDRSLAKAKSGKSSSSGAVDLGDNDPLEGL